MIFYPPKKQSFMSEGVQLLLDIETKLYWQIYPAANLVSCIHDEIILEVRDEGD